MCEVLLHHTCFFAMKLPRLCMSVYVNLISVMRINPSPSARTTRSGTQDWAAPGWPPLAPCCNCSPHHNPKPPSALALIRAPKQTRAKILRRINSFSSHGSLAEGESPLRSGSIYGSEIQTRRFPSGNGPLVPDCSLSPLAVTKFS